MELKSNLIVELSETELDNVAGGLSVTIGDVGGFSQTSGNGFTQKGMTIAQQTFAGPNGSGTASAFDFKFIDTFAAQSLAAS
ncbi:MAG: CTB family bacteriocin [Leptolyngbya sp. Prado105]|jgi:hypothetical protein|nr:CTB family bacteriocin [Leptolyngbya sp. Prado105]